MKVFVLNKNLLKPGTKCYNVELAQALEALVKQEPRALYNGSISEKLDRVTGGNLKKAIIH